MEQESVQQSAWGLAPLPVLAPRSMALTKGANIWIIYRTIDASLARNLQIDVKKDIVPS
jgi:hypothetical protein